MHPVYEGMIDDRSAVNQRWIIDGSVMTEFMRSPEIHVREDVMAQIPRSAMAPRRLGDGSAMARR